MTNPRNAASADGKRFYTWRGSKHWSVTTILNGGMPKPAIPYWAAKRVAECTVENIDFIAELVEKGDRDGAIDFLKRAPWRDRDKAGELGSAIHVAAEAYALGKPQPPWPLLIRPQMEAFARFLEDYRPKIEMTEASVFSANEKYAGTLDCIGKIGKRRLLWDVKSGSGVYPEVGLQLALYRFSEFIGLPDGSQRAMPAVDGCAVLHLNDQYERGYDFREVRADDGMWRTALYVREVFRFIIEDSKHVLGPTIKPPRRRKDARPADADSAPSPGGAGTPSEPDTPQVVADGSQGDDLGALADAPSGSESEQTTLLPHGQRSKDEEDTLGIDIFGAAI